MTETTRVLGVDPGTTTGLAVLDVGGPVPQALYRRQFEWNDAGDSVSRWTAQMRMALGEGRLVRAVVTCERFTVSPATARRGQSYIEDAMGMIGVVRRACAINGIEMVYGQVSAAKKLVSDDMLKKFGLHERGQKHSNDAFRHCMLFCVKTHLIRGVHLL